MAALLANQLSYLASKTKLKSWLEGGAQKFPTKASGQEGSRDLRVLGYCANACSQFATLGHRSVAAALCDYSQTFGHERIPRTRAQSATD